ncbi:MAG: hypothetical protein R3F31_07780 [Verrucomicrobiales bacterium]
MANILMRGAYDKVGEQVGAAVPAALGNLPAGAPRTGSVWRTGWSAERIR